MAQGHRVGPGSAARARGQRAGRQDRAVHPRRRHQGLRDSGLGQLRRGVQRGTDPAGRQPGHPAVQRDHRRRTSLTFPHPVRPATAAQTEGSQHAQVPVLQHQRHACQPDDDGRRRQQHRQRQHDRLQVAPRRCSRTPSARCSRAPRRRRTGSAASNPAQVGLGVRLAGITTSFTQGAAQTTGRSTDLMLQGDGFFIVNKGGADTYTRNGSFGFDASGNLVNVDGGMVQGWTALNGNVDTKGPLSKITLPLGTTVPPVADRQRQLRRQPALGRRGRLGPHREARRVRRPGQRSHRSPRRTPRSTPRTGASRWTTASTRRSPARWTSAARRPAPRPPR